MIAVLTHQARSSPGVAAERYAKPPTGMAPMTELDRRSRDCQPPYVRTLTRLICMHPVRMYMHVVPPRYRSADSRRQTR